MKRGEETDLLEAIKLYLETTNNSYDIYEIKKIYDKVYIINNIEISVKDIVKKKGRCLNSQGETILKNSKIDEFLTPFVEKITEKVRDENLPNPYQGDIRITSLFTELYSIHSIKNEIENLAFKAGCDVLTLLNVAALCHRDTILKSVGLI